MTRKDVVWLMLRTSQYYVLRNVFTDKEVDELVIMYEDICTVGGEKLKLGVVEETKMHQCNRERFLADVIQKIFKIHRQLFRPVPALKIVIHNIYEVLQYCDEHGLTSDHTSTAK